MAISQEVKREVFNTYNGKCAFCGNAGTETDHIVPVSLGGSDEISNLQLLCKSCNLYKSGKTLLTTIDLKEREAILFEFFEEYYPKHDQYSEKTNFPSRITLYLLVSKRLILPFTEFSTTYKKFLETKQNKNVKPEMHRRTNKIKIINFIQNHQGSSGNVSLDEILITAKEMNIENAEEILDVLDKDGVLIQPYPQKYRWIQW